MTPKTRWLMGILEESARPDIALPWHRSTRRRLRKTPTRTRRVGQPAST